MIRKKTVALTIAVLTLFTSSISFADPVASDSNIANVKVTKLAGSDRYKTGVEISKYGWAKSQRALLVNGTALPDALCASPLADEYNAPILLTEKDKLNQDTLNELKRLGVKTVTLVGSEGVISKSQEDTLKQQGFSVERLGGVDRYDTSLKVANTLKGIYQSRGVQGKKVAFIANGVKGLADATSVSSPAGIKDGVILYSNGTNLSGIKGYIESSTDEIYIIGSEDVVSKDVEAELKRTGKQVMRLGGNDRKETNASVIKEFFPNKDLSHIFVAKDGMGKEDDLVDGLAVGSLASKNKAPVVIASDELGNTQETVIECKAVSEVTQVGDGRNENPTRQAVGVLNSKVNNGIAGEDNMKIPKIQFAKEQNLLMRGNGGYETTPTNIIQGDLYVKYGNPKTAPHSYGSVNQQEYDYVTKFVRDKLNTINFRLDSDWVYTQHFINNGNKHLADDFIDPVLAKNGINVPYKSWRVLNNYIAIGLQKGIMSREDAEQLAMYNSAVSHVKTYIAKDKDINDGTPFSAMDAINGKIDCDSSAQLNLLICDTLKDLTRDKNESGDGMNGVIVGSPGHVDVAIIIGNYYFEGGRKPTIKKSDNVFDKYETVLEAPTYAIN